ncbi:MAG: hypothetical protein ACTHNU_06030, partial [Gaiellales bacterium]
EVKGRARELLVRAAERAESLGAASEAQRYYTQAVKLSDEPLEQAGLLDQAGEMAFRSAAHDQAFEMSERARRLYEEHGQMRDAARASARMSWIDQTHGRMSEAVQRMERAHEVLSQSEPDADLAMLASRLGAAYYFAGDMGRASAMVEQSLDIGEALGLPEVLAQAWVTKGIICASGRRPEEARGFFQLSLELADRHGLREDASRASGNLSDLAFRRDRYTEALAHLERGASAARMIGSRPHEWFALSESTYALFMLGRWDEATVVFEELPEDQLVTGGTLLSPLTSILEMHVHRGDVDAARRLLDIYAPLEASENVQGRCCYDAGASCLRFAEGRHAEALDYADRAIGTAATIGPDGQDIKMAVTWGIEAALAMHDRAKAEELVEWVEAMPPGLRPPSMALFAHRTRARLAGSLEQAEPHHVEAVAGFRGLELPFWLAVAQVEYAEALIAAGRGSEAELLLAEARPVFERLQVGPWLERTGPVVAPGAVEAILE